VCRFPLAENALGDTCYASSDAAIKKLGGSMFQLVNDGGNSRRVTVLLLRGLAILLCTTVSLTVYQTWHIQTLSADQLAGRLYPSPPVGIPHITVLFPAGKERRTQPNRRTTNIPELQFTSPREIPKGIPNIPFTEIPNTFGVPNGVPGGEISKIPNFEFFSREPEALPVPPPPPPPPPVVPAPAPRARVGGNVIAANLISQVKPAYPQLARQARISGVVVLEAEINKEGSIENLKVITGHPLLIQAAIAAVKQWRYKPTLLNSEPVAVVTTITVNFAFAQ